MVRASIAGTQAVRRREQDIYALQDLVPYEYRTSTVPYEYRTSTVRVQRTVRVRVVIFHVVRYSTVQNISTRTALYNVLQELRTAKVTYRYFLVIQAKRGMGALPASRVSILMLRNVRGA